MPIISRSPATGVWLLTTPRTSYALRIDDTGAPCHVAWGPRLTAAEADSLAGPFEEPVSSFEGRSAVGEELPVDGGTRYGPPSLQVRYADGSRAFEWEPVGHRVDDSVPGGAELVLEFRDRVFPLSVALHYRVRADTDVIERWTVLRNDGDHHVDLLRADSAAWTLPPLADYRLSHVTGQWSAETQLRRERLPHGETVLTSRTRHHESPRQPLDDARRRHRRRGPGPGVVHGAGVERQLADHGAAHAGRAGGADRRCGPRGDVRAARAGRGVHHARVGRVVHRQRFRRGEPGVARVRPRSCAAARRRDGPGALQLLGGHRFRRGRGGPARARRARGPARGGAVRRGRRLVRRAAQRPGGPG